MKRMDTRAWVDMLLTQDFYYLPIVHGICWSLNWGISTGFAPQNVLYLIVTVH